ncbi:MAG TPA: class I SAM-dependent methyltransferase [Candidatus Angelobacter sp.]|nr:class I SAM-dependent methyltransferase [Candidatus Angelobacter sp.]
MNYREQEKFLQGSRIWGGIVCLAFLAATVAVRVAARGRWRAGETIVFPLVALAIAVLMYYTPDYLHLSVTPEKKRLWEIKLRWRIMGAALVLGMALTPGNRGRIFTLFAVAWLAAANWLAHKKIPAKFLPAFFWITDLVLLFLSLIDADAGTAGGTTAIMLLLLAASAHLAIVRKQDHHLRWAAITFVSGLLIVSFAIGSFGKGGLIAGALPLVVAIAGTVWLVRRARAQNAKNVDASLQELIDFTGYSAEQVRHLWATSNQQLAENWQHAKPVEDNPEQMAEWYRQNSELYLFAISAYNLEYKRIRSNMKVLRLARGATLDYGAGNGEVLLEIARRGQRAAYYDVEGVTMRFAQQRAARQGLAIDFFHAKDALAAAAGQQGFDTVFSFDVLEHLPDLPGELTFLSSLLRPGGVFVFDVPAGSTKAHPMHLNHNLDVLAFMHSQALVDERGVMLRLPFRKEEKYVFRKPS